MDSVARKVIIPLTVIPRPSIPGLPRAENKEAIRGSYTGARKPRQEKGHTIIYIYIFFILVPFSNNLLRLKFL